MDLHTPILFLHGVPNFPTPTYHFHYVQVIDWNGIERTCQDPDELPQASSVEPHSHDRPLPLGGRKDERRRHIPLGGGEGEPIAVCGGLELQRI